MGPRQEPGGDREAPEVLVDPRVETLPVSGEISWRLDFRSFARAYRPRRLPRGQSAVYHLGLMERVVSHTDISLRYRTHRRYLIVPA